jgi:hypothetical protein
MIILVVAFIFVEMLAPRNAVPLQDILESHDTQYHARIPPTHYGQNTVTALSHASQRETQRMIEMDVRHIPRIVAGVWYFPLQKLAERARAVLERPQDICRPHEAYEPLFVFDQPRVLA